MEISPIAGIVSLPVVKAPPPDLTLVVVSDVENTARIGDETYSPGGGKSAEGQEDELDDSADDAEDADEQQPGVLPGEKGQVRQISFFA